MICGEVRKKLEREPAFSTWTFWQPVAEPRAAVEGSWTHSLKSIAGTLVSRLSGTSLLASWAFAVLPRPYESAEEGRDDKKYPSHVWLEGGGE